MNEIQSNNVIDIQSNNVIDMQSNPLLDGWADKWLSLIHISEPTRPY